MEETRAFHYYDLDFNEKFESQEFTGYTPWELTMSKIVQFFGVILLVFRGVLLYKWISAWTIVSNLNFQIGTFIEGAMLLLGLISLIGYFKTS